MTVCGGILRQNVERKNKRQGPLQEKRLLTADQFSERGVSDKSSPEAETHARSGCYDVFAEIKDQSRTRVNTSEFEENEDASEFELAFPYESLNVVSVCVKGPYPLCAAY